MHDMWPKVVEETKTQNPLEFMANMRNDTSQSQF